MFYVSSLHTIHDMRSTLILYVSLLLGYHLIAQTTAEENFNKSLKAFSEDVVMQHASWGFSAYRIADSKQVVTQNPHISLVPASVMKVVTTSAALLILGENFRFETHLLITGKPDEKGILQGDLIIRGFGDPTLGSERWDNTGIEANFSSWINALKTIGIKGINGNIIGDGSSLAYNFVPDGWQYDDIGNYYGAGAAGLNIRENVMRIFFEPSATLGSPARILRIDPPMPLTAFVNHVTTGAKGSGDKVNVYGSPYAIPRIMKGSIPAGAKEFEVKASMPDPAAACALLFKNWIMAKGISVNGEALSITPGANDPRDTNMRRIHIHQSPPLSSIIKQVNFFSINIFAEALHKAILSKLNEKIAADPQLSLILFLKNRGISISGMNIADGSGLSRTNLLTTDQLAKVLLLMSKEKNFEIFRLSLPIAGQEGTVRNFLKNKTPGIIFRIKSGYIGKVRAYAGYVGNEKGELLCFSIIVNNFDCTPPVMRQKIENLLSQLPQLF